MDESPRITEPPAKMTEQLVKTVKTSRGPSEWNLFVQATWERMAEEKGVTMTSGEDAKDVFKKAAAAAGVSYMSAMKEAAALKDAMKEPKVAKVAKVAVKTTEEVAAQLAAASKLVADLTAELSALTVAPKTKTPRAKKDEPLKGMTMEESVIVRAKRAEYAKRHAEKKKATNTATWMSAAPKEDGWPEWNWEE